MRITSRKDTLQPTNAIRDDAAAVERRRRKRTAARNCLDAHGFAAGFQEYDNVTNLIETTTVRHALFQARIAEISTRVFRDSDLEHTIGRRCFIPLDVTLADVDCEIGGFYGFPAGAEAHVSGRSGPA